MGEVKEIRTEADYAAALARVEELMDAELGTPEGEQLNTLADLVERYESRHLPIAQPSPPARSSSAWASQALTRHMCGHAGHPR